MSYLSGGRRRRRRWPWFGVAAIVLLVAGAGAAFLLTRDQGDVSNPNVPFTAEQPPPTVAGTEKNLAWPVYGYSKARTHYLPAPHRLRPPYRRVWTRSGAVLLEFPPVIGRRSLYLLKNNGALYAISKRTGRVRWKRKLGSLAASSPAYGHGTIYVVLLKRFSGSSGGRVAAIAAKDGRTRWSRKLTSRAESSPLLHSGRLYFGTESGAVMALRASDGALRWTYHAAGAVKGGLAFADGKLFFGDYAGKVQAIRAADGGKVWVKGTHGGALGLGSGNFYSTAAVAFGRVYIGNTDGRVYSYATDNGALAWRQSTGSYVYASPAVAQVPGTAPTVYIGSYDGYFYALDARSGKVRWRHRAGGKISGAATVVGDIVYYSNLGARTTTGLGVRTGAPVFFLRRGAFNPVVSDGRRLFVTGYSSLYAFAPARPSSP